VLSGACALQGAVAARLGLLGAFPGGAGRVLGGERGLGAGVGVKRTALRVLGGCLGVSLPSLSDARALARGLLCLLCPCGGRERCLSGLLSREPFAAGGRLLLGGV